MHGILSDLECGGFTYRGAKGVDQPFLIHFFRLLPPYSTLVKHVGKSRLELIWTSYKVKRKFVALPGAPVYNTDGGQLEVAGPAVAKFMESVNQVWSLEHGQEKKSKAAAKLVWPQEDVMGIVIDPFNSQRYVASFEL